MTIIRQILPSLALAALLTVPTLAADPWVVYRGDDGPGNGKHAVLISGDEEYRSEEFLPQLGRILARHHGFTCTVLFAVNPTDGTIDPNNQNNIPGLDALDRADLMIISTRFRDLPDDQMRHIDRYVKAGKPIIGIRTATHAFSIPPGKTYSKYSFNSREWDGGFGRQILGETWIDHHGHHAFESTRGAIAKGMEQNAIVRGCDDLWGPSDVYTVRLPLPDGCKPLVLGQVLEGMKPTDKPVAGAKNDPMLPVAWTKTYKGAGGQTGRVFTTTMGCGEDFQCEGLRRLVVNAAYWCLGLEDKIPAKANVAIVDKYHALPFGGGKFRKGVAPADHAMLIGDHPAANAVGERGKLRCDSITGAKFKLDGAIGQRVKANVENWLLAAPTKNPELVEVYAHREANHEPPLVPWVGEFAGKYLISAVQAMRMSDDPRLRATAGKVVDRLLQLQTADGYLGAWPKKEQLLAHWDLWDNYHVMLGLLHWHEQTGDEKALAAARRAADLVCKTYLDAGRRVFDAGSPEMNMGIVHVLAILYEKTGEPRYLDMANMIVKDFQRAGDYYRLGLAGEEFFRTPKPRWESLHSLQGMAELYRITGDDRFRRSFLNHWASIRRFDLRNTGGFSSGEQATGNPYANQAIETCCTIAWETVMLDALRLTGDSTIADDLETATLNAVAGAQHPSGQWCTYNTPMDGVRVPSHVDIAFQARPGGMFLNCCSVNGPRGLGMIGQCGIMRDAEGLVVNWYGSMHADVALADGTPVVIDEATDYPVGDTVRLKVGLTAAKQFTLALRIPAWSSKTAVSLNGKPSTPAVPGEYLKLTRLWRTGDEITLKFDLALRYESGDLEQAGKVSLYRGPILLCIDDRFQTSGPFKVDVAKLDSARPAPIDAATIDAVVAHRPWLVIDLPSDTGKNLRLIDFASAGATGKAYRSWLPAVHARPPRPAALLPADGATMIRGPIRFSWRSPAAADVADRRHTVVISDTPSFERTIVSYGDQRGDSLTIPAEQIEKLDAGKSYCWKIVARNAQGQSESIRPCKRFSIGGP